VPNRGNPTGPVEWRQRQKPDQLLSGTGLSLAPPGMIAHCPAMKRTLTRIAVVALLAASAVAAVASPALAAPSGIGWSGSWEYTSPTALAVHETIPGASLSATGTDDANGRSFTVSLSDTSLSDNRCAQVTWHDGLLSTIEQTCGPTIQFTPYSEDDDVSATLCLQASNGAKTHCNFVDIPSGYYNPFIRNAGWGFSWSYYASHPGDSPEDWGASLKMGQVWFDFFGIDNYGSPTNRLIEPYLLMLNTGLFACGSATMASTTPASTLTLCGPERSQELPATTSTGPYGTGGVGCVWSGLFPIGQSPTKDCVSAIVPMPS
jgi:hypothetical protein